MNASYEQVGLSGIGCALPGQFLPLEKLPLVSSAETMAGFGFTGAYIAEDRRQLAQLSLNAARCALDQATIVPADLDAILWAGALPGSHIHPSENPTDSVIDAFCYSGSWLQDALAADRASVSGIAQQGCAGMFSAIRSARALLIAEPDLHHILCVGADALPSGSSREILYNVISDAACAVVISRNSTAKSRYRWIAFHQISKGWYWDIPTRQSEIIAAYFPTARLAIQEALRKSGLAPADIDLVIPTGVNASSWPILLNLCGIPQVRLFQPATRFGHTIAADSFLMLQQAEAAGALHPGMRILLFAYGFGSSWSALILEVQSS